MNKNQTTIGVVVAIVLIGFLVWSAQSKDETKAPVASPVFPAEINLDTEPKATEPSTTDPIDVKNETYTIDDRSIALTAGVNQTAGIGTTTVSTKTTLLNDPAFTDIDRDGKSDAVVILRDETGGSGMFYYAAVVLSNNGTTKVSNSVFLGDRVRIKAIRALSGIISVDILDRATTESFATPASLEKTITLSIKDGVLVENK
jgi:hypothetical protein